MVGTRTLKWISIFLFVAFLQTSVVHFFAVAGVVPDVVLIALFILSIVYGRMGGIWAGFFVGLLLDVYSAGTFGTQALAYTLAGALLGFFEQRKLAVDPLAQVILLLVASLITETIIYLATFGIQDLTLFSVDKLFILSRAIYTAIVATFVLGIKYYILPSRSR